MFGLGNVMTFTRIVAWLALVMVVLAGVSWSSAAEDTHDELAPIRAEERAAGEAVGEAARKDLHAVEHALEPGEEAGHNAHGAHGGGNSNPLEFKTDLALWTGVIFLVLMAVLWKFAWGPISEGLEARENGIAKQISDAEQSNVEAKQLLSQYEAKLAQAKDEVREIFDKARKDAEEMGRQLVVKAKTDAEGEYQRATRQIDTATAAALQELATRSSQLAVELAGKIVGSQLKAADHTKLIEQAVSNFAQKTPSNN